MDKDWRTRAEGFKTDWTAIMDEPKPEPRKYLIHLINGKYIEAFEDYEIPEEERLPNRFAKAKWNECISAGRKERYYIPKKNILYINEIPR